MGFFLHLRLESGLLRGRPMKKTRLTEEQMEHEAGETCADLYRKHGISEGPFYLWKGL